MNCRNLFAVLALVSMLVTPLAWGAQAPPRDQLGREVKLRIVVDKVMQPKAGWKCFARHYAKVNAAGGPTTATIPWFPNWTPSGREFLWPHQGRPC